MLKNKSLWNPILSTKRQQWKAEKKTLLQPMKNCNSFATKNYFYCINTLSEHINLFHIAINSKTITKLSTQLRKRSITSVWGCECVPAFKSFWFETILHLTFVDAKGNFSFFFLFCFFKGRKPGITEDVGLFQYLNQDSYDLSG